MKIRCPDCKGKGHKDFYGSTHRRETCAECEGSGKVDFVEVSPSQRGPRVPVVCPHCKQKDCGALFGASLCGPVE